MTFQPDLLSADFRALSARLGKDPLQVQGPGGNTSVKNEEIMWIKASGTELTDAKHGDIFVPVDRRAALSEARDEAGDGSCKSTVLDPATDLRPSIETTFHAALDHSVVAHTHSVATLVHAICPEGREAAAEKLSGLPFAMVPYAKPGLPLTREILKRMMPETRVFILQNHGLIVCGATVADVSAGIADVESRLAMPSVTRPSSKPNTPPEGFQWAAESWMAVDARVRELAISGSYYPDHVVFLGPALPTRDHDGKPPAIVQGSDGILVRDDATSSQRAMLKCLSDVLRRLPADWTPQAIGDESEAELLNWDAEKYRRALAART